MMANKICPVDDCDEIIRIDRAVCKVVSLFIFNMINMK